jgi:hypothetical protein
LHIIEVQREKNKLKGGIKMSDKKKKNPVPDETWQLRGESRPVEQDDKEVDTVVKEKSKVETEEEFDQGVPLIKPQGEENSDDLETIVNGFADQIMAVQEKQEIVNILKNFLKAAKGKSTRRLIGDPIKRIEDMTTIEEVRSALKVAYAKKSKAKDNPEALARYNLEIDTAKRKLNELLAGAQADPMLLKDMGEEVTRILQSWIIYKEGQLKDRLKEMGAMTDKDNLTKVSKTIMVNMSSDIPENLKEELATIDIEALGKFEDRLRRGDKRVENIVKMQNFVDNVKMDQIEENQKEEVKE